MPNLLAPSLLHFCVFSATYRILAWYQVMPLHKIFLEKHKEYFEEAYTQAKQEHEQTIDI